MREVSQTETERHRCEVRTLLRAAANKGRAYVRDYLADKRVAGRAAHGSADKGMGIKACDLTLFPACCDRPGVRGCHGQLDQGALFKKAVRHELEPVWAADTQRKIQAMGLWPKTLQYPATPERPA